MAIGPVAFKSKMPRARLPSCSNVTDCFERLAAVCLRSMWSGTLATPVPVGPSCCVHADSGRDQLIRPNVRVVGLGRGRHITCNVCLPAGKMIDNPTVLQARNVLALAERLENIVT